MFKLAVVTGCAALVIAAPARADLTPSGPATLVPDALLACTTIYAPEVLLGWKVTVGDGSSAGTVRPLFPQRPGPVLGDAVELPAAPGTYTFAAPRFTMQSCGYHLGLVQTTGSHAIVTPSSPLWRLDIQREGQADERRDGAALSIAVLTEPDTDVDQLGDRTEDRTDLRVSAVAAGGRAEVTVTNAGPLPANLPELRSDVPGKCDWSCRLDPLAVGASRLVVLDRAAVGARVRVASEGPDLAPADNEAVVAAATPTPFGRCGCARPPAVKPKPTVTTAPRHTLRRGVKVTLRGQGSTRVTAAFEVRGRTRPDHARRSCCREESSARSRLRAHGREAADAAAGGGARCRCGPTITVSNADGTSRRRPRG